MKHTGSPHQRVHDAAPATAHAEASGPQGAALVPPAYGIAAADQAASQQAEQREATPEAIQLKADLSAGGGNAGSRPANHTGMPDALKAGVEQLSGLAMDDVRVHYNSPRPAQVQALAYAQGTEIHIGHGQERHLPHEAWHVVQQKQGRVRPTMQLKGAAINDDSRLEREADTMGTRAIRLQGPATDNAHHNPPGDQITRSSIPSYPIQRLVGYEVEAYIPIYGQDLRDSIKPNLTEKGRLRWNDQLAPFLGGGLQYGQPYGRDKDGHFHLSADHNVLRHFHKELIEQLVLAGYLKQVGTFAQMTNIEYITPPRDEHMQGISTIQQTDIKAIRAHLEATFAAATSEDTTVVPDPAHDIYTGVPVKLIQQWIANDSDWQLIEPTLIRFMQHISRKVYVQETTGILPQDIPGVYEQASKELPDKGSKLAKASKEVLLRSIELAREAYTQSKAEFGNWPKEYDQYKSAIIGYLTMAATFALSTTLSFTSIQYSTPKNLLAYYPRIGSIASLMSLPEPVRPKPGGKETYWIAMIEKLFDLQKEHYGTEYWIKSYNVTLLGYDKGFDFGFVDLQNFLDVFEIGEEPLEDPSSDIPQDPYRERREGRNLSLDIPHPEIERQTLQKGIPFEDRRLGKKATDDLSIDILEAFVQKRFSANIERGLQHLEPSVKSRLAHQIGQNPSGETMAFIIYHDINTMLGHLKPLETYSLAYKETVSQEDILQTPRVAFKKELKEIRSITSIDQQMSVLLILQGKVWNYYQEMVRKDNRSEDLLQKQAVEKIDFKTAKTNYLAQVNRSIEGGQLYLRTVKEKTSDTAQSEEVSKATQLEQVCLKQRHEFAELSTETSVPEKVVTLMIQLDAATQKFFQTAQQVYRSLEK